MCDCNGNCGENCKCKEKACGEKCEVITRPNGYLRAKDRYCPGKQEEVKDRVTYDVNK